MLRVSRIKDDHMKYSAPAIFLLLGLLATSAPVSAADVFGGVSLGGAYNTNIAQLTEGESIQSGVKKKYQKGAVIEAGADIGVSIEDFEISWGGFLSYPPMLGDYSRFSHVLALEYEWDWDTVMLNLSGSFHHVILDLPNVENLYVDGFVYADLSVDIIDPLVWFAATKVGYYHSLSDTVGYMTGPAVGLETGLYIYPTDGLHYIRLSGGFLANIFEDEFLEIADPADKSITKYFAGVHNSSINTFVKIKGKMYLGPVNMGSWVTYGYGHWLKEDSLYDLNNQLVNVQRRTEHKITVNPWVGVDLGKGFGLEVYYRYQRVFSSFDADASFTNWYINWNFDQHVAGLTVSWAIH